MSVEVIEMHRIELFFLAKSSTTNAKWPFSTDAKSLCRNTEKIENDEKFRNVGQTIFSADKNRISFVFLCLRDQMRQMRKWQKQYGNRADPRQHVKKDLFSRISS